MRSSRLAERQQIARAGAAIVTLSEQPLQIQHARELFAKLGAKDGLTEQFATGIEAGLRSPAGSRRMQAAACRSSLPPMPVAV